MTRRAGIVALAVFWLTLAARADDAPPPAANPPAPAATDAGATAEQIGRSIFIANDVDGKTGDTPAKKIAVNDDVMFEEDITTGSDAKAVLEFRDGSTFEVGPDAAVRIDSFVFNPEESTSHKALSVTRGVFRYVSAYVASDQETKITTPSGSMGIRGSVAEGVVDPAVPDFLYLGEGRATFTNSAGSSTLQPGNSIAVPSAATPPMAPEAMPVPVAAQALQAIESRLPPRAALASRPAADDAWLKRAGAADLVPAAEQQRAQQAAAISRPLPSVTGHGRLAGELGLLTEANRLQLFNGRQATRTLEQTAFLARAARENPNAVVVMRRFNAQSAATHRAAMTAGTEFVIRGVGHAARSAEVMRRVTAASVRANPGAAALINRHAGEAYRGPDRGGLTRPVRPQNSFERKVPGERNQRSGNAQTPRERAQKAPPREERLQNRPQREPRLQQTPPREERLQNRPQREPRLQQTPPRQQQRPQKPPPRQPQKNEKKGDQRDQQQR
jgi:hypothetical protein